MRPLLIGFVLCISVCCRYRLVYVISTLCRSPFGSLFHTFRLINRYRSQQLPKFPETRSSGWSPVISMAARWNVLRDRQWKFQSVIDALQSMFSDNCSFAEKLVLNVLWNLTNEFYYENQTRSWNNWNLNISLARTNLMHKLAATENTRNNFFLFFYSCYLIASL